MPPSPTEPREPSAAVVAAYNAVPNIVWSVGAFWPLVVACAGYVEQPWLWGVVAAGLSAYAWPVAWLRRLQLSSRAAQYKRLGVPAAGRLAQQGALVNRLLRRRYPGYRVLAGPKDVARLIRATYQQERFHWAGLMGFGLVSGHEAAVGHWGWAGLLALLNVGYNLYPIWLQQYLRIRLHHLLRIG